MFKFLPNLRPIVFPTWFAYSPKTLPKILRCTRITLNIFFWKLIQVWNFERLGVSSSVQLTLVFQNMSSPGLVQQTFDLLKIALLDVILKMHYFQDFILVDRLALIFFFEYSFGLIQTCKSIFYVSSELQNNLLMSICNGRAFSERHVSVIQEKPFIDFNIHFCISARLQIKSSV